MGQKKQIETIQNFKNYEKIMAFLNANGYTDTHYWSSGWRAIYTEHGYSSHDGDIFVRFNFNWHETNIYMFVYHLGKKVAQRILK